MSGPSLLATAALMGMNRAQSKLERTAERLASLPLSSDAPQDEVDLSEEMVNLVEARNSYEANLRSLETADEITEHVIDLIG